MEYFLFYFIDFVVEILYLEFYFGYIRSCYDIMFRKIRKYVFEYCCVKQIIVKQCGLKCKDLKYYGDQVYICFNCFSVFFRYFQVVETGVYRS